MRRTRPLRVPHLLSFSTLLASFSIYSQCIALARPPAPGPELSPREEFEYPKEHVILADCTQGEERHLSSQMAYYNNTPTDKPMDIAIVDTQPGQFALWINSNTTAIFTDTGVYFTATLGPTVPDGEWAGYGHNGMGDLFFHNFNCWRSYQFNLYEWQNARCSQVYYCNHDPRPANAPDIVVTTSEVPHTTQTLAPGASGAVPGSDSSGTGTDQSSSPGLSHGALIGTIVGSVAVLVVGGLLGLWFLFRRRSRNKDKNKNDTDTSGDLHEADDGTAGLGGSRDRKSPDHANGRQELDAKLERFEMDTEAHRFEMANNMIAELDGTPMGWETKDPSDIKLYDLKQDIELHNRDSKGGDFKYHPDTRDNGDVRPTERGEMVDNDAVFDEPKTMFGDELKARAIDKQVIRASTGAGSAAVASWTNKDKEEQGRTEEQQTGDDIPLRAPPTRSQTTWTTWTTDSDVDLAGFPLSSVNPVPISPISPLSPSGPRPPNG